MCKYKVFKNGIEVLKKFGIGIGIGIEDLHGIGIGIGIEALVLVLWYGYWYRYPCFRLYIVPEVRVSVCSEPKFATGGTDQRLAAFETKEAIMGTLLGDRIDKCPNR